MAVVRTREAGPGMEPVFDPGLPPHAVAALSVVPELLLPADGDPRDPSFMPWRERLRRGMQVVGFSVGVVAVGSAMVVIAPELVFVVSMSALLAIGVYGATRGSVRMLLNSLVVWPLLVALFVRSGPLNLAIMVAVIVAVLGWQTAYPRFAGRDPGRTVARYHGRYLVPGDFAPADRALIRRVQEAATLITEAGNELHDAGFDARRATGLVKDRIWLMALSLHRNRRPGVRTLRIVVDEARRWTEMIEDFSRMLRRAADATDDAERRRSVAQAQRVQAELSRPFRY